jgi:sugar transferase (PEP-CTERM/EpsH1 system associated)
MSLRILFVTPYVPSSVRIRPLALIRELARRGHQVTLVCLVQPEWEARYLKEVTPYCQAVHPVYLKRLEPYPRLAASLFTPQPLSVAYCDSPSFRRTVESLAQREAFDLVHTEFVRAAPATMGLNGRPKVFDLVDSTALAYRRSIRAAQVPWKQRMVAVIEWSKLRSYERQIVRRYDRALISSPADAGELQSDRPLEVLPNGVDLTYFAYDTGKRKEAEITFLGKMSYYVNVASVLWFYRQVFPRIRQARPEARLVIVGRDPAQEILALAEDPAVEVTGTVADVRPYLQRATLTICPMVSGAGIQNKMLEAMAVGAPCVATSLACQALQIQPGREALVADSAADFAQSVIALLENAQKRQELAEAGRRYVERCHDWQAIGAKLENVYLSLAKQ